MRLVYPIGHSSLGPLFCRLPLGFFLFLSGVWGIQDPEVFGARMVEYTGSSSVLLTAYSAVAPYLAVGTGALLMLGLFTTGVAFISAFLLLPLLIAAGVFSHGLEDIAPYIQNRTLFRDLVLLGVSLSLLFTGAGALSIDAVLQRIYGEKKEKNRHAP